MTGAVAVAGVAAAYQSGLPLPILRPLTANRSLTMKLRPARGPELLPGIASFRVWGTRALTGSLAGTVSMSVFRLGAGLRRVNNRAHNAI